MDARQIADRRRQLQKASGAPVHVISGATRQGVPELLEALWKVIEEARRK
jgi:GTP-binding protein